MILTYRQTAFLAQGFKRLDRAEQDYLRNLVYSLLLIQNSGDLSVETQDARAVITLGKLYTEIQKRISGKGAGD